MTARGGGSLLPHGVRPVGLALLSGIGLLAAAGGVLMELSDTEPPAQLWLGAAAGVAFLAALPWVSTDDVHGWTVRARLLVGAGVSTVLAVAGLWQVAERSEPRVLLLLVPALLLFVTAGLAVREAQRLGERLARVRLLDQMRGRESERRLWARELHDQTLQDLAAIDVVLGGLGRRPAAAPIRGEIGAVREQVREEIAILRHLVNELRPLALDELGLVPALEELALRTHQTTDVVVRVDLTALPGELSPDAQVAVYRIVQEALSNAVRHAECGTVRITAELRPGFVVVAVRDDGDGAGAVTGAGPGSGGVVGHGRAGMVERATALGGTVAWAEVATGGTEVILSIPWRAATGPSRPDPGR